MIRRPSVKQQKTSGVYLLCFSLPVGNDRHRARHYVGWAKSSIHARVQQHKRGSSRSAKLTRAAVKAGARLRVAAIWQGQTRTFERALKNRRNHAVLCPFCREDRLRRDNERQRARYARNKAAVLAAIAPACEFCGGSGVADFQVDVDITLERPCPDCCGTGNGDLARDRAAYRGESETA